MRSRESIEKSIRVEGTFDDSEVLLDIRDLLLGKCDGENHRWQIAGTLAPIVTPQGSRACVSIVCIGCLKAGKAVLEWIAPPEQDPEVQEPSDG